MSVVKELIYQFEVRGLFLCVINLKPEVFLATISDEDYTGLAGVRQLGEYRTTEDALTRLLAELELRSSAGEL